MDKTQISTVLAQVEAAEEAFAELTEFLKPFVQKHAKASGIVDLRENRISINQLYITNNDLIVVEWSYYYGSNDYYESSEIPIAWFTLNKDELDLALEAVGRDASKSALEKEQARISKALEDAEKQAEYYRKKLSKK